MVVFRKVYTGSEPIPLDLIRNSFNPKKDKRNEIYSTINHPRANTEVPCDKTEQTKQHIN
jgi:hypothetical protein